MLIPFPVEFLTNPVSVWLLFDLTWLSLSMFWKLSMFSKDDILAEWMISLSFKWKAWPTTTFDWSCISCFSDVWLLSWLILFLTEVDSLTFWLSAINCHCLVHSFLSSKHPTSANEGSIDLPCSFKFESL